MQEALPPTAEETASAVLAKIDEMDIDEIKAKIPSSSTPGSSRARSS